MEGYCEKYENLSAAAREIGYSVEVGNAGFVLVRRESGKKRVVTVLGWQPHIMYALQMAEQVKRNRKEETIPSIA